MMFVGPGWLNKMGRWEASLRVTAEEELMKTAMKYYGELKKEGKLTDMTMAEFADYYQSEEER